MNDQLLLRKIADRESYRVGPGFDPVAHIAKVLLELVETLAAPQPVEEVRVTGTATYCGGHLTDDDLAWLGVDNSGSIVVDAIATGDKPTLHQPGKVLHLEQAGPISADELKRRGCDDELDARAIDVVLRCGWPRQGDPLGIRPCVPVPAEVLERMLDTVATISGVSAVARTRLQETISRLLDEQERIQGLYLKTAEEKSLIEPG